MSAADRYPGITKACLEIALDNGGINRLRSVEKQGKEFEKFLGKQPEGMLDPIEEWLSSLSDDQLSVVCAGGQDEPETIALLKLAPPFTDDLLNAYFDEVC